MEFEALFLEKADRQKFQMFQILTAFNAESLTVADLAARMDQSYQMTYNVFQELATDMGGILKVTPAQAKKRLMARAAFPFTVDEYRLYLMERSIAFQFIDYLLQGNRPTTDHFTAEHFISRSTLTRKTAPLRKFLQRYQLKLSVTQPALLGPEPQIRLFLGTLYWLTYHGIRWPFVSISEATIAREYRELASARREPLMALQEIQFWGLCRVRIAHGNYVRDVQLIDELFADCPLFAAPSYDPKLFFNAPADVPHAEQRFFCFLQQKTIIFTPPSRTDRALYEFFKQQNGPVWQFATGLLDHLRALSGANLSPEALAQTQVPLNVMRFACSFVIMNGDYVKLSDFFVPQEITYQQSHLRDVLADYLRNLPSTEFNRVLKRTPCVLDMLFYLFAPFLRYLHWDETVAVKVQLDANDFLNHAVLDFLDNLPIVRRVAASAPAPDLVLTTPEDAAANTRNETIFDWHVDATTTDYFELYHTVLNLYRQKLIPDRTATTK